MNAEARAFDVKPAVREAVGLLIGIVGPSSSGKTYTALRLASGMRRIVGGEIDFVDTENRRALYYADKFRFNHLNFTKPFSPLDYLEAIRHCVKRGAKTIVVDSASHEHEGPGGVLEWHAEETKRVAAQWKTSEEKAQMAAWGPPKAARRRLINEVLQMNVNLIFTFRAKEKIKIVTGKNPIPLGWQPICGEEFMYEFALQILLPPGSEGRPRWNSDMESERAIMKLPSQFRDIFLGENDGKQLDERTGERLAEWAAGGVKLAPQAVELIAEFAKCEDEKAYKALEAKRAAAWKAMPPESKQRVKAASEAALERLAKPSNGTDAGGGLRPAFTSESAVKLIRECKTEEDLRAARAEIWGEFNGDVPIDVEASWNDRAEALKQGEL